MIQLQVFQFNPFQENTYLLWDEAGNGLVFDPGCYEFEERKEIKDFITAKGIQMKYILNTHAHIDHVLGVSFFQTEYKIPFCLHLKDKPLLDDAGNRAQVYGFPHYQAATVDQWISETDRIQIGEFDISILFVPGHAPGHVAFYLANEGWLIGGDVLFKRSVGRTDFPLCNHADLVKSIQTQLYTLPESTIVYPGHGSKTTIGEEKQHNPYVKA